jgi:hypothetical protein
MAADERIHGEVVRGLAARGRTRAAGSFRAAVFGANDGLVSNLALVLGIGATGVPAVTVLFTGIAGLLAGALSMGAGEYVSVRSQRELLEASRPDPALRRRSPTWTSTRTSSRSSTVPAGCPEADAAEHAAVCSRPTARRGCSGCGGRRPCGCGRLRVVGARSRASASSRPAL